ncbi:MAG: hypothetical protein HC831_31200 [Chloroflexia bacterium]|nr:hypothetical protein [Chloroflexia bacterium]
MGLSESNMSLGNLEKALEEIKKSQYYFEKIHDLYEITNVEMKCGYFYLLSDSVHLAKHYYQKAIDLLNDMNDTVLVWFPKSYLAMVYSRENNYQEAIPIWKKQ